MLSMLTYVTLMAEKLLWLQNTWLAPRGQEKIVLRDPEPIPVSTPEHEPGLDLPRVQPVSNDVSPALAEDQPGAEHLRPPLCHCERVSPTR
jgi:hypothetical protein